MPTSIRNNMRHAVPAGLSRRDLFRKTSLITAVGLLPGGLSPSAEAAPALSFGADMYQSIGVRPLINCKGVFTSLSGSLMLPEVRQAMAQASMNFVHIDELMEAVGKRLAAITGAEWGIVSSSATAGLTHATSACITGGDPEKIRRLPDLSGLKNEVIMPKWSRNFYDHSIRMVGVDIIEVETVREFREAINHRTAMAAVLGDRFGDPHPNLADIAPIARQYGIPLLVDAAADFPVVPNPYIALGADMVVYSGGKIIRGPQTAGLLLGREKYVRGAALHAVVDYAVWAQPDGGLVTEAAAVIERELDGESPSCRAACGMNLTRLFALDESWLVANLQWLLDSGDQHAIKLANALDAGLIQLEEQIVDMAEFHATLDALVRAARTLPLAFEEISPVTLDTIGSASESLRFDFGDPFSLVTDLQVNHSFA
ncbi:MAG: aminotransferase class V-fold PLP-dependent enzyme [Acidobacteria bacterium]|nr:aminotransferase class V-fold PLP-dependent enzyme [Acidobacteriota bacterium]